MSSIKTNSLAIDGGSPVRTAPWPKRHLFGEAEKQAAVRLFDQAIESGDVIGYGGAEEQAYCEAFAAFMGGGYADAVNSGTSAVYVALKALDLEPFGEVIVPPISDPGGVMPVPMLGLIPVPADAAPGSYNAGPEQIEARINERTRAILVAHIAGHMCDMDPIVEIACRHELPVIEDCAQAHGALYRGRLAGTHGYIAAFSTMSGKHHATGPQGGVVFCRDESLYWKVRRASDRGKPFGIDNPRGNVTASQNLNNNDLGCAVGRVQLEKLPAILADRRRSADALARACDALQACSLNTGLPDTQGAYWFLLLHVAWDRLTVDKPAFVKALQAEGIPCNASYWHSPTAAPWCVDREVLGKPGWPWTDSPYAGDPSAHYDTPNAKAADDAHIMLPFHEKVGEQEVADIAAALTKLEAAYLR